MKSAKYWWGWIEKGFVPHPAVVALGSIADKGRQEAAGQEAKTVFGSRNGYVACAYVLERECVGRCGTGCVSTGIACSCRDRPMRF